jgi:hypothetical protein
MLCAGDEPYPQREGARMPSPDRTAARLALVAGFLGLAAGCAAHRARRSSDAPAAPAAAPAPRKTFAVGFSGDSALDSAMAFRLCTAPDSVLAGLAPCYLKNQAPPIVVRRAPPR